MFANAEVCSYSEERLGSESTGFVLTQEGALETRERFFFLQRLCNYLSVMMRTELEEWT